MLIACYKFCNAVCVSTDIIRGAIKTLRGAIKKFPHWSKYVNMWLTSTAFGIVPFGIAPFGIAPFGIVPFGIAPFGIVPFGIVPFGIAPFGIAPFKVIQFGAHIPDPASPPPLEAFLEQSLGHAHDFAGP